jgi:hypothetical protein
METRLSGYSLAGAMATRRLTSFSVYWRRVVHAPCAPRSRLAGSQIASRLLARHPGKRARDLGKQVDVGIRPNHDLPHRSRTRRRKHECGNIAKRAGVQPLRYGVPAGDGQDGISALSTPPPSLARRPPVAPARETARSARQGLHARLDAPVQAAAGTPVR